MKCRFCDKKFSKQWRGTHLCDKCYKIFMEYWCMKTVYNWTHKSIDFEDVALEELELMNNFITKIKDEK